MMTNKAGGEKGNLKWGVKKKEGEKKKDYKKESE